MNVNISLAFQHEKSECSNCEKALKSGTYQTSVSGAIRSRRRWCSTDCAKHEIACDNRNKKEREDWEDSPLTFTIIC